MRIVWRALRRLVAGVAGLFGPSGKDERMYAKMTLEEFTDRLGAGTPTPGGGSAAALAGCLSASLLQMVCDLTIGREAYRAHEEAARDIRRRAEGLRKDLLTLVDRDAEAYDAVIRAIRMPKGTPAEKEARGAALSRANLFATETPLATADACAVLLGLAIELARKGNVNAVSDVGSAALLAYAGLRAGVMNVRTNLGGIADAERAGRARDHVRRLEVDAERFREEALAAVISRMTGR
jgi:formiminotetrahydrofolate cyclodeaminase